MSRIITCEQVSDGHPDKICDSLRTQSSRIVCSMTRKHELQSNVLSRGK